MDAGQSAEVQPDVVGTALDLNLNHQQSIRQRLERLQSELSEIDALTVCLSLHLISSSIHERRKMSKK